MFEKLRRLPSPALVISVIALILAIGGSAIALAPSDNAKDKKIAKKVANKLITKRAKNLSVKHALTADSATNAGHATTANSAAPSGSAGGGLTGNYPSPTIAAGAVTADKLNVPAQFTDVAGLEDAFGSCGSLNGWVNWSPDVNNRVGYYRGPDGIVHLEGVTTHCGTFNTIAFNLPPGYRPTRQTVLAAAAFAGGNAAANAIVIFESDQGGGVHAGDVEVANPAVSLTSLDGLTFRCGPSGQNGCP